MKFRNISPVIDFPDLERKLLDHWYSSGIVKDYLQKNSQAKKRFSFIDGPITANNPMGVHHGWGRTYKDLWQRFYNMLGYRQRFQNGFDCQGLWVEVEVEKELGIRNKKDIENLVPQDKKASIAKFVSLCKDRVKKYSQIQTEQSKRLGNFMDWEHSYYTMSDENNYMIWHFLKTCHTKGWIYKGKDSVPWCPRCQTAISQHEMLTEDYKELVHETVLFKLPVLNRDFSLVAWTTTPWTIPANVALAVNPNYKYRVWKYQGEKLIIVSPTEIKKGDTYDTEQFMWYEDNVLKAGFEHEGGVEDIEGGDLVGLKYRGPFDNLPIVQEALKENPKKFHTVVAAEDLVVANKGTGILHVAPGAGQEDFRLAQKEKLPVISLIADDAAYLDGMGEFTGKNAKKHPEDIINYLIEKENGKYFLNKINYKHRYPACWRCKTELVWKVTNEWYIAMDIPEKSNAQKAKTLREQMITVAKMIRWIPEFGLERELDWLKNMHDWLISKKNRYWGLALPIYECECGWFDVLGSKDELHDRAISGWSQFEGHSPHKPYIDEVEIKCQKCVKSVKRLNDVGNVWLDAGIVPFSTLVDPKSHKLSYTDDKKYWSDWFPADFITESFPGQFKNWFYSLIAMATVLEKKNSFKTVLGFASALGEDGRPMHKSWGNSIEFNEAADKIGVDVMRWMYLSHNPKENLLFGYKKADETRREFHLKLWNVYNFFVTYANASGWKPKIISRATNKSILDKWILERLNQLIRIVTASLIQKDIYLSATTIHEFVDDLSVWYVRRIRSRVSLKSENDNDRTYAFSTLHSVLIILSRILAPFVPFLSEEIYTNLTSNKSVHLSDWPILEKNYQEDLKLIREMSLVRRVSELGHAERKNKGIKVRQPLRLLTILNIPDKLDSGLIDLIKDELNIKNIAMQIGKYKLAITLDTQLTKELREEGQARELIRKIQIKRKELGCTPSDEIIIDVPNWPTFYTDLIKNKTGAKSLNKAAEFKIKFA